jgi:hypothetical protein
MDKRSGHLSMPFRLSSPTTSFSFQMNVQVEALKTVRCRRESWLGGTDVGRPPPRTHTRLQTVALPFEQKNGLHTSWPTKRPLHHPLPRTPHPPVLTITTHTFWCSPSPQPGPALPLYIEGCLFPPQLLFSAVLHHHDGGYKDHNPHCWRERHSTTTCAPH